MALCPHSACTSAVMLNPDQDRHRLNRMEGIPLIRHRLFSRHQERNPDDEECSPVELGNAPRPFPVTFLRFFQKLFATGRPSGLRIAPICGNLRSTLPKNRSNFLKFSFAGSIIQRRRMFYYCAACAMPIASRALSYVRQMLRPRPTSKHLASNTIQE